MTFLPAGVSLGNSKIEWERFSTTLITYSQKTTEAYGKGKSVSIAVVGGYRTSANEAMYGTEGGTSVT